MGNRFNTRIESTRIKHTTGPVSTKRYDKFHLILRIETTVVNVSFFKHDRQVEHEDGSGSMAWANMKNTIYSLAPLQELLLAANATAKQGPRPMAPDCRRTNCEGSPDHHPRPPRSAPPHPPPRSP